jgi:hypothetical protein
MAIGKVNAYATVEGTPTDFGKMTVDAIDRYNAEEDKRARAKAEKEAAKAKATQEELKDLKSLDKYAPSGVYGIDDPALSATAQLADKLYEAKLQVQAGNMTSIQANHLAEKGNQAIAVLNQGAKYVQDKASEFSKNSKLYNPEFIDKDAMEGLLKNTISEVLPDGSLRFRYKDKDGEIITSNPKEIADKVYDIPLAVNINEKLKGFKAVVEQDKIAKIQGGYIATETEKSKDLISNASVEAQSWVSDKDTRATLWSQYERTLPEKDRVGPKKDDFSEEQLTKLYNYSNDYILNSYNKEKELTRIPTSGGGGDGAKKEIFKPSTFDPSKSFTILREGGQPVLYKDGTAMSYGRDAASQGLKVSDESPKAKAENQIIVSNLNIYSAGKVIGKAANALITDIVYDKRGKLIATGSYTDIKTSKSGYKQSINVDEDVTTGSIGGEQRKTFIQPLGKSQVSAVLAKLRGKVITAPDGEDITIRNENDLKRAMGYKKPVAKASAKSNKVKTNKSEAEQFGI